MTDTTLDLPEVLQLHSLWLQNDPTGKRADLSGAVLSGADLRGAVLSGANLSDADLSGAVLSGADLRGADMRWADLSEADLSEADLREAVLSEVVGNMVEIKSMQIDTWRVVWTADTLSIGCQQYSIEIWAKFSDQQISRMDTRALEWWLKWRPILALMPGLEALAVPPAAKEDVP